MKIEINGTPAVYMGVVDSSWVDGSNILEPIITQISM